MTFKWLKKQDEEFGKLRDDITRASALAVSRGFVIVGMFAEFMVLVLTHEKLTQTQSLGFLGYYLRHEERRAMGELGREIGKEIVEEHGEDIIDAAFEALQLASTRAKNAAAPTIDELLAGLKKRAETAERAAGN